MIVRAFSLVSPAPSVLPGLPCRPDLNFTISVTTIIIAAAAIRITDTGLDVPLFTL
jgi:hypothetical protein